MSKYFLIATLLFFYLLMGCKRANQESELLDAFTLYFEAVKNNDDSKWKYTSDTVKVWFEKSDKKPQLRYKGKKISKWGEWDRIMNSKSYYDSIWYNKKLHAVQGYFYESNDFYDLIGASPNKTLRTYSLNDSNKITDLLYERVAAESTILDEHLNPIYEWALKNDSLEIVELYPNKEFVPSTENAIRWKKLLEKYREIHQPD